MRNLGTVSTEALLLLFQQHEQRHFLKLQSCKHSQLSPLPSPASLTSTYATLANGSTVQHRPAHGAYVQRSHIHTHWQSQAMPETIATHHLFLHPFQNLCRIQNSQKDTCIFCWCLLLLHLVVCILLMSTHHPTPHLCGMHFYVAALEFSMMATVMTVNPLGNDLSSCLLSCCTAPPCPSGHAAVDSTSPASQSK